jgi:sortase A
MQQSFTTPPLGEESADTRSLLGLALRRPGGKRSLSTLTTLLALAGVVLFAYPLITDIWSAFTQRDLRNDFGKNWETVAEGDPLTRMRIPSIDVDILVVEGTSAEALRAGAGHYRETPLPGEAGNMAIAGHRTTYGRPLLRMDELGAGDEITLETPYAIHTYRVTPEVNGHENPWIVSPTDIGVVGQEVEGSMLTLTTCHPKGSARQRLILRAELTETAPLQSGR